MKQHLCKLEMNWKIRLFLLYSSTLKRTSLFSLLRDIINSLHCDMAKKTSSTTKTTQEESNDSGRKERHPVVVVMGHIDHGKSTLLDYIRNTNVAGEEVGGITQHLSAYIVEHTTKEGKKSKITFLDTPGHEAFQKMRLRGADVADIAILIVSAEDGVMPQTKEALASILQAGIPYIVAINKIDKPGADIPRTQASLIENEIYIEGMGGDIPWTAISAKSGTGVGDLLDLLILVSDINGLSEDRTLSAVGTIIEGKLDLKRGATATLMIADGTLKNGEFVVSGNAFAPVRIMEDWSGKTIKEAHPSEPVGIVGWSEVPQIGSPFHVVKTKRDAEKEIAESKHRERQDEKVHSDLLSIPLIIKSDVVGTIDAIRHELAKFSSDRIKVRVIGTGVGRISLNDVQNVGATKNAIIVGFNVEAERAALDLAERQGVEIRTFNIIYELSEWLAEALKQRTPKKEIEEVTGKAKVLKHFSTQKNIHVIGARLEEGSLSVDQKVRVMRRDIELGKGTIRNLQQLKANVDSVTTGEFGAQVETKVDIAPGDHFEAFNIIIG